MNRAELQNRLLDSITQRFRSSADLSLSDYIFSNSLFHSISEEQVEFMFGCRAEIIDHLGSPAAVRELVQHCIHSTRCYTYERNQFVNFTREYEGLMEAEYTDFIRQIRHALQTSQTDLVLQEALVGVLEVHHERLRLIMASYCVAYQENDLHANPLLRHVPCEEYSAGFQLAVLGVELHELVEPVLDLGCGSTGTLVHFLRQQGLSAFGVDRLPPTGPYFFQSDWFEFDLQGRSWGCVLAHQSLSTHFLHAHLQQPAGTARFSQLTMKILSGLQKNSFLCYAPGMPFFENQIEKMSQFTVMRRKISMQLPEIEQIAYSTKILKVK